MSMTRTALGVVLFGLCGLAPDGLAQVFTDKTHGFEITYPRGWQIVPIQTGEQWIFAKFLCKKPYRFNDKQGITREHQPLMRVIGFPTEIQKEKKGKIGDIGEEVIIANPYKNYEDYLDRHHQGGGWFFSVDEDVEVGEMKARYREIKVEKLATIPKRIFTITYHTNEMDYVCEVDVLANKADSMKRAMLKSLKTFKLIEKGPESEASDASSKKLEPLSEDPKVRRKQIAERRKAARQRLLKRVVEKLPEGEGWWTKDTKNFLVLSRADKKETLRILKVAEEMRDWLDKRFESYGRGEVLKSVIRVCETVQSANAYLSGSNDSFFQRDSGEVVCAADMAKQGWDYPYGRLGRALIQQYMTEKNDRLYDLLPNWLTFGMGDYVSRVKLDKKKGIEFDRDIDDFLRVRKMKDAGRMPDLRKVFLMTDREAFEGRSGEEQWDYIRLACLLSRFIMEAPSSQTKFFDDYMKQLIKDVEDFEDTEWKKATKEKEDEPMTEEEEDERFRKGRSKLDEAAEKDRKRFLENAFKGAFGDWDDKDWQKLQYAFLKYAGA